MDYLKEPWPGIEEVEAVEPPSVETAEVKKLCDRCKVATERKKIAVDYLSGTSN